MKRVLFLAIATALVPTAVMAGTCAVPTPIDPQQAGTQFPGSTCGGEIGINLGGVVLGHPTFVYSFVANNPNGNVVVNSSADINVAISPDCSTAPIAIGAVGLEMPVNGINLVNGQTYLLFVTTDPSLPVTAPPTCNAYNFTIPTLPVSLQGFSVE